MSIFSKYDCIEDLEINGSKDLKKFILSNYLRFPLYELSNMLGVTPGFIQETLSVAQLKKMGKMSAATVLIIRDIGTYQSDKALWEEEDGKDTP